MTMPPGGAVELGQDDPGDPDGLGELAGWARQFWPVVASGRAGPRGPGRPRAPGRGGVAQLLHQVGLGVEAPAVSTRRRRPSGPGRGQAVEGDGGRVGALLVVDDRGADAVAPDGQLLGGGGPEGVGGGQHRLLALLGQGEGELADGGRLAGAVDPDDQHDPRTLLLGEEVEGEAPVGRADGLQELARSSSRRAGPLARSALALVRRRSTSSVEVATPTSAPAAPPPAPPRLVVGRRLVQSPDMPGRGRRERPSAPGSAAGAMTSSAGGAAVATPRSSGRSTSATSRPGRGGCPASSPTPGSRSRSTWATRSASWRRRRPATRGTTASRPTITRVAATTRTISSPSTTSPRCGGDDVDVLVNGARA